MQSHLAVPCGQFMSVVAVSLESWKRLRCARYVACVPPRCECVSISLCVCVCLSTSVYFSDTCVSRCRLRLCISKTHVYHVCLRLCISQIHVHHVCLRLCISQTHVYHEIHVNTGLLDRVDRVVYTVSLVHICEQYVQMCVRVLCACDTFPA